MHRCPSCDFDNAVDALFCVNCGSVLPTREAVEQDATRVQESRICANCGHQNPEAYRFCTECGTELAPGEAPKLAETPTAEATAIPEGAYAKTVRFTTAPDLERAEVTHLVSSDEAESHRIEGEFVIGRVSGDLQVPDDPYLSGSHVAIRREAGRFILHDMGSTNGTFVRLRGPRTLEDGDVLMVGSQLFRYHPGAAELVDGAAVESPNVTRSLGFGGPHPRLERVLEGGREGESFPLLRDKTVIGRSKGDLVFEDDEMLSDVHATVTREPTEDGVVFRIQDEESRRGVFVKIQADWRLETGEVFTAGRQVFRFELHDAPSVDGQQAVKLDLDPTLAS